MKKIFLFSAILSMAFFNLSYSQENKLIKIDSVDMSKDELFSRAKSYIAYAFKSANSVTQLDDKENGKIITKGNFTSVTQQSLGKYASVINFTLTIDVRDGRFRGVITDLYHDGLVSEPSHLGGSFENDKPVIGTLYFPKNYWIKVKEKGVLDAQEILENFAAYMKSKSETDDF